MAGYQRIELPLIAIDPGKHVGWALAVGGRLVDCGTINSVRWNGPIDRVISALPRACFCVIEMPRVYPSAAKWKGDPQHIVRLAFLAGRIGERFPAFSEVEPRQWQGGSPPDHVLRRRTQARLTVEERTLVESRKLSAHVWDAIGILVFSLHRTNSD